MITYETVTAEVIRQILKLYEEICGGYISNFEPCGDIDRLLKQIEEEGRNFRHYGYRIGSTWDPHSKLRFWTNSETGQLCADMHANFHPEDRVESNAVFMAAQAAGERFEEEVLKLTS